MAKGVKTIKPSPQALRAIERMRVAQPMGVLCIIKHAEGKKSSLDRKILKEPVRLLSL